MTLEQIKNALQDRRIDKVMDSTGLSRTTIAEIRDGKQTNPTWETISKLSEYLKDSIMEKSQ